MTLLLVDDRSTFTAEHDERYALGPTDAPLLVLNTVDDDGCAWIAEVEGWHAPTVETPLDRRPNGHGGYIGASSFDPLTLAVEGSVSAPTRAALRTARDRLLGALLGDLTGFLRYTHLDDAPAKGVWSRIVGQPKWREPDDRYAEFAFVLLAEDPIKTGDPITVGPVRLASLGGEGGYPLGASGAVAPWTSVGGVTVTETRWNRLPNPAAATGYAYWGTNDTATAAVDWVVSGPGGVPWVRHTRAAGAVTPTLAVNAYLAHASGVHTPATEGEVLEFSLDVQPTAANREAVFYIGYLGGPGDISAPVTTALPANQTTRITITVTVPVGVTGVVPVVQVRNTLGTAVPSGEVTYMRRAYLGQPGAYFDGASTDTADTAHGWTGTANASPSVQQSIATSPAIPPGASVRLVPNDGDEPAHATYRITGPIPEPIVQLTTGEYVHLRLTLGDLDEATVDTADGTVQVNGVNRYDAWGPGSTFPLIPPGGAEVRLLSYTGGDSPAAGLLVVSAPSWR